MKKEEVQEIFLKILREEEDVSAGVAAIRTLLTVIENYKVATVRELDLNLQLAVDAMRHCDQPVTAISSGCELFMRFITFTKLDVKSFEECEQIMLQRGHIFFETLLEARGKVAKQALPFISDGCKILTHSRSRVVLQAMLEAAKANKRFHVYVTMSGPDNSGRRPFGVASTASGPTTRPRTTSVRVRPFTTSVRMRPFTTSVRMRPFTTSVRTTPTPTATSTTTSTSLKKKAKTKSMQTKEKINTKMQEIRET